MGTTFGRSAGFVVLPTNPAYNTSKLYSIWAWLPKNVEPLLLALVRCPHFHQEVSSRDLDVYRRHSCNVFFAPGICLCQGHLVYSCIGVVSANTRATHTDPFGTFRVCNSQDLRIPTADSSYSIVGPYPDKSKHSICCEIVFASWPTPKLTW